MAVSRRALIQLRDADEADRPSVRPLLTHGRNVQGVAGLWLVELDSEQWARAVSLHARAFHLHPDPLLKPFPSFFDVLRRRATQAPPADLGLNEVLERVGAPKAWAKTRGEETFIAIFDSGVSATLPEVPKWKRAGGWAADGSNPWVDDRGHGTMCACIAAGNRDEGGRFNGVAPMAKLYSCKIGVGHQDFYSSDVIEAYSWLLARRNEHGQPIIANNSFGFECCAPPKPDGLDVTPTHPLAVRMREAIAAGVTLIFAAGNSHGHCGGGSGDDRPNTIWAWNSLPSVLCVGNVDENNVPWDTSSRGPGQWATETEPKPDCVAPTYGEVAWGDGYRVLKNGWGSSGAAPQAAGLAALIAAQRPSDAPPQRLDRIRATCDRLGPSHLVVGAGLINCEAAVY